MPRIERSATVAWEGNVARGAGTITAGSGAFARLPFTLPSRTGDPGGKTSPEELLAAAAAGCFAMALGSVLTPEGTRRRRLLRDVARQRAHPRRDAARPAGGRLPDRHGRGAGRGAPDRRRRADRPHGGRGRSGGVDSGRPGASGRRLPVLDAPEEGRRE